MQENLRGKFKQSFFATNTFSNLKFVPQFKFCIFLVVHNFIYTCHAAFWHKFQSKIDIGAQFFLSVSILESVTGKTTSRTPPQCNHAKNATQRRLKLKFGSRCPGIVQELQADRRSDCSVLACGPENHIKVSMCVQKEQAASLSLSLCLPHLLTLWRDSRQCIMASKNYQLTGWLCFCGHLRLCVAF